MFEEALEIHHYLPIRKENTEEEYITHLWHAVMVLDSDNEAAQPFMIMPLHLLFMLALQYKALRIRRELSNDYSLAFTLRHLKNHNELSNPTSVFDFSLLSERTLPDLFRLIGSDELLIKKIKKLIDYRNDNLAHANGGIARDVGSIIEEYLDCLRALQKNFLKLNDVVADKFKLEMTADDLPSEFIESRLLGGQLCQADFENGQLKDIFGAVGSYM